MKTIKSLMYLIMLTVLFWSCSKEDASDTVEVDSVSAKNSLEQMSGSVEMDVVEMVNAHGTKTLTTLIDLLIEGEFSSGRIAPQSKSVMKRFKKRLQSIQIAFLPVSVVEEKNNGGEGFNFQDYVGVYEWDSNTEEFIKTETVTDIILIKFPTEGSSINNAVFRVLEYDEQKIQDEFSEYFLPTKIVADLLVDDVLETSLNYDMAFDTSGLPSAGIIKLFVAPFDYELKLDNSLSHASIFSTAIKRDQLTICSSHVQLDFATTSKEKVNELSGNVIYGRYKIEGNLDVQSLDELKEEEDINDFIQLQVFDNEIKIGDILFEKVQGSEEEYDAFIIYPDGSKESLEIYLQPILDAIEDLILEIEGVS